MFLSPLGSRLVVILIVLVVLAVVLVLLELRETRNVFSQGNCRFSQQKHVFPEKCVGFCDNNSLNSVGRPTKEQLLDEDHVQLLAGRRRKVCFPMEFVCFRHKAAFPKKYLGFRKKT